MDGEARYSRVSTWDDNHLRVGSLVLDQPAARPAARQDRPTERASEYRLHVSFRKSLRLALGGIPCGRERIFIWFIVRARVASSPLYTICFIFGMPGLEHRDHRTRTCPSLSLSLRDADSWHLRGSWLRTIDMEIDGIHTGKFGYYRANRSIKRERYSGNYKYLMIF